MKKALIIDDVDVSRYALSALLEDFDLELREANDTKSAKAELSNNPDVVFLDWHLRKENGLELIDDIKRLADVPVIVISGVEDDTKALEARRAGATDFLTKPVDRDTVKALLGKIGIL